MALAVASLALQPCALARKARVPAKAPQPVEAPPPDPLAGAWPSRQAPQLGDGTFRSELLVAARRLVGLSNSFDEDGFLRHLAYVLDLAYKRDLPDDAWVRTAVRRAAGRGVLKKDAKARPGDLAVFSMDRARPGSPKAARLLIGVVESSSKGVVRFIAPLGDTVSRAVARPGKKANPDDTAIIECRTAEPPRAPPPSRKGKAKGKGKAKAPKPPRALPCRAGEMWIGRIPADSLAPLF